MRATIKFMRVAANKGFNIKVAVSLDHSEESSPVNDLVISSLFLDRCQQDIPSIIQTAYTQLKVHDNAKYEYAGEYHFIKNAEEFLTALSATEAQTSGISGVRRSQPDFQSRFSAFSTFNGSNGDNDRSRDSRGSPPVLAF